MPASHTRNDSLWFIFRQRELLLSAEGSPWRGQPPFDSLGTQFIGEHAMARQCHVGK